MLVPKRLDAAALTWPSPGPHLLLPTRTLVPQHPDLIEKQRKVYSQLIRQYADNGGVTGAHPATAAAAAAANQQHY